MGGESSKGRHDCLSAAGNLLTEPLRCVEWGPIIITRLSLTCIADAPQHLQMEHKLGPPWGGSSQQQQATVVASVRVSWVGLSHHAHLGPLTSAAVTVGLTTDCDPSTSCTVFGPV